MPRSNSSISIAIVEDHPIVIEGLRKILGSDPVINKVYEYTTGTAFIQQLEAGLSTDMVLLDISLPDTNGVDLCREIKEINPEIIVLGFSNHSDRSLVLQLLNHGASGYLLKNASAVEIIQSIKEAIDGKITFNEEIRKIMTRPSAGEFRQIPPLTKREKQVLQKVSEGKTSVEIASELQVSPLTIETHRRNLMQKLEAKNVVGLIKIAIERKLI